jgi:hypothetical protein
MEPFDASKTNLNSLSRESLIKWLQWNDPNGVYSDADSIDEGMEPLTKDEAIELIKSQSMGGTKSSNRSRKKPKNMKLKKGSKAAKDYMAKIRKMKGSSKVGATSKKISKETALKKALQMGVDFNKDFHAQSFGRELLELAKESGYKKSPSSTSSTGRAFFYNLQKLYDKGGINGYEGTTRRGGKTSVNYTNNSYKALAKKTAKKTARKKVSGIGRRPDGVIRKGAKTSVVYMNGVNRHTDTKSHNVNIRVLSGVKHKKLNVVSGLPSYKDPDAAREIELYADNNSQLYFSRKLPILKNLQKKFKKGQYNIEKSAKLWRYYIDDAMQRYQKEFGTRGGKWHQLLTTHDRQLLAMEYAENTLAEFELGNFVND